mgnify:CR=1 FL=1
MTIAARIEQYLEEQGVEYEIIDHPVAFTAQEEAAASHVPPPLIRQLKPGGNMIIPVGSRFLTQQLLLVSKDEEGNVTTQQILPVRFVPLTGKH